MSKVNVLSVSAKSAIVFFASISIVLAGGPKLKSGNPSVVKGEKKFNVQMVWDNNFDYDGDPFNVYYAEEVKDMTKDNETEELKTFENEWKEWKAESYPDGFSQGFNSELEEDMGITASRENTDAKYTLIVKTIELIPGGLRTAVVDVEVTIVETANPSNVIAVIENVEGAGRLPGPEKVRVQDAYRQAGDEFASNFLLKKVLKK
jgi:hypothetical protein